MFWLAKSPSLFWEFAWFCGQAWLEYNLLSNYICRLYRAQCTCVIHFLLRAQALEWFRVMRPLGAFVLVFLEAQIKSTCISHNSLCIFPIQQCIIKQQLLNSVTCDICNNQGLGKCNQLRHLLIPDITKTPSKYYIYMYTVVPNSRQPAK